MFKIITNLKNFFLNKNLIFFLFLFFLLIKTNYVLSDDKIYLDLLKVKFENNFDYKKYQTSSDLLIKTNLDKEIQEWIGKKVVLKGNSGELIVKILNESIIDNFHEKHIHKYTFLDPKNGLAYRINFKIKIIAENKINNVRSEVLSIVEGDKTFLGSFSINERSEAVDEVMKNMIKKLKNNLGDGMNNEFRDFLTNKYS